MLTRRNLRLFNYQIAAAACAAIASAQSAVAPDLPGAALAFGAPLSGLAHGDVNSDGRRDAVVAAPSYQSLILLLGTAGGLIPQAPASALLTAAGAFAVADLDHDTRQDAVTFAGSNFSVLLGNGAGGFGPRADVSLVNTTLTGVALADLNNDTHPDALFTGTGGTFTSYSCLGDGAGGG